MPTPKDRDQICEMIHVLMLQLRYGYAVVV